MRGVSFHPSSLKDGAGASERVAEECREPALPKTIPAFGAIATAPSDGMGHHMCAGATTSFDGGHDLETGLEGASSDKDTVTGGDEERDKKQLPGWRESVATIEFYTAGSANVRTRSVRERPASEHLARACCPYLPVDPQTHSQLTHGSAWARQMLQPSPS